jgi:hypothetical protein
MCISLLLVTLNSTTAFSVAKQRKRQLNSTAIKPSPLKMAAKLVKTDDFHYYHISIHFRYHEFSRRNIFEKENIIVL